MQHASIETLIGINVEKFLNGEYSDFNQLKAGVGRDLDESAHNGLQNHFHKDIETNFKIVMERISGEIKAAQSKSPSVDKKANDGIDSENGIQVGDGGFDIVGADSLGRTGAPEEKEIKSKLERQSGEISEQENKLADQYRPIITKDCLDKFFKDKESKDAPQEEGPPLTFLLKMGLSYKASSDPSLNTLIEKIDGIEKGSITNPKEISEIITQSIANLNIEHLRDIDRGYLGGKNSLTIAPSLEFSTKPSTSNTRNLEEFFDRSGLSGDMLLQQGDSVSRAHSDNVRDGDSYNIASVGKIFTGVLAIKMIQEGVLSRGDMEKPAQLDPEIMKQLPENVQKHLGNVTLHQLMTHTSGLTDYLSGYDRAIRGALKGENDMPNITRAEDYLQFAEDTIVDVPKGETRYSNLGSLLTGLAIQSAYNRKNPGNELDYHSILEQHILKPANMEQFSIKRPENSCSNPLDPTSPHLCGGPAGGYWTNAESLGNFGQWVSGQYNDLKTGAKFQELLNDYGQEFYNSGKKEIRHWGTTPSISADLAIYPEENTTSAILTNRPLEAFHANRAVCNQLQQNFVSRGKFDATQVASEFPDDPNITRYTVFDPKNVYRSPHEVAEIHRATGLNILPKGNVLQPENGNIGVELISFRPERIAQQLTMASINMQAQMDEESFPVIVDDVFKNHVAKEMGGVIPKVENARKEIGSEVQMALEILNKTPDMNLDGVSQTIKKVKEAKDLVQSRIDSGKYKPESPEAANDVISKYATDLIYNDSKEVFGLIEEAVDRGMQQALKAGSYKPLPIGPNSERVAIVVAGGPASGKTQATQMALESVPENQAMSFSTDQLRTMVSPKSGPPSFTDQEANLVFRQVIGKVDKAMKQDRAPTILSEGTGLNPGAIAHLLTGEGTKVDAYLISIPAEEALRRASSRAESKDVKDQGRSYSDEYLLGLHKQDGITLLNVGDQLKGQNVKLSILDNDVKRGEDPKVVAEIDFKSGKLAVYNIEALAKIEQKAKLDPKQQKDQGMYDAQDKLPENNMSFLSKALKDFEVTFKDGKGGKEYASSKPNEKLQVSDHELFEAKKKQNPHDNLLEQAKDYAMGIDRKENLEEKVGFVPIQKTNLEALDLAVLKEKEIKEPPKEKSWVEKMADKKLSTSKDGYREI